jgi:hypothetical protein
MAQDTPADPSVLRAEIEQTRDQLRETVEALAAKTDVKARAKQAFHKAGDDTKAKVHAIGEQAGVRAANIGHEARTQAAAVRGSIREADLPSAMRHPVVAAIAATALAGLFVYLMRRRHHG